MLDVLSVARKYVDTYKWSVIPIRPDGSKAPALPSWKEYQKRFPTPEELQNWFKNSPNWIGIVTGQLSQLSVADVDSKKSLGLFQSPVRVQTPRGSHTYLKFNENLKNWVRPTEAEWDIRTEGGYVVAPGSPGYRFVNPYFGPDTLSALPEFPLHLLSEKTEPKVLGLKRTGKIGELLANLKEGNRDASFTSLIGLMHSDRYAAHDIASLLAPYAEKSGFGVLELEKKIKHILKDYPNPTGKGEHSSEIISDDVSTFLQDITPVEWLVPGLVAKSSIGFMAGLPETFKTWLMLDLAIECARGGGKWLGRFNTSSAKVLFVDQERHKSETQRRFNSLLNAKGLSPKLLRDSLFIRSGSTTRLDLDESFRAFKARLSLNRPDMVIVDSWVSFKTTDDNDRATVQKVIERIKEMRDEFKCSFLFIDHESKSVYSEEAKKEAPNAYRMAGSVGKIAAAESIFTVRKYDPATCMVYQTKNTLAPCIESFSVNVNDTPNGVVVSSQEV